ncbi:alpha/beta hydrolase [Kutzneria chonburiensis]|uniref:Alpha/beta hydrolase n=1 Tax=Kutzneria chonburiensis TaxID=1483604 RepID=A0ABV6N7E3_9PSEU|nr:alpha/beta hydrolase [Kutzneria chonburiensis]
MSEAEIVLVHGAWHGSWCWDLLRKELGRPSHVVDLPSMAGPAYGVEADAKVIREKVDSIDGPVLLVGHSYGGIPVSQAAVGAPNVAHLAYLAAFQIEAGESLMSTAGRELPPELTMIPVRDDPIGTMYSDVSPELAREAVARLRPQSALAWREKQVGAAWRDIPSTYVLCERDQSLPPEFQEIMAKRATAVRRLPSGHSLMVSMPVEVAALLDELASAVDNA